MKFGVVNKSTTVNRFFLHTLQRNITHLAVITRKSNIKLGVVKRGTRKEPFYGVTGGFTRLNMKNTYVCHYLISPHVNFHSNRPMLTKDWLFSSSPLSNSNLKSLFNVVIMQ